MPTHNEDLATSSRLLTSEPEEVIRALEASIRERARLDYAKAIDWHEKRVAELEGEVYGQRVLADAQATAIHTWRARATDAEAALALYQRPTPKAKKARHR